MRFAFVLYMLLSQVPVSAQEGSLPPLPSREEPVAKAAQSWESYARTVVLVAFPEHAEVINGIQFLAYDENLPGEFTVSGRGVTVIQFTYGTMREVRSPTEFAVLIGHEVAHEILGHPTRSGEEPERILFGPDPSLIVKVLAEEMEADLFTARSVPDGFCAVSRNYERRYETFFADRQAPERHLWQMDLRRHFFRELCEQHTKTP